MPRKTKRPCSHPGCPNLTESRFCEEHQKAEDKRYNKYQRDPETRKRYGSSWRRIRARQIKEQPMCQACEEQGHITPATEVHHITPLSKGGTHEAGNLMSLCTSCHSRITAADWKK